MIGSVYAARNFDSRERGVKRLLAAVPRAGRPSPCPFDRAPPCPSAAADGLSV